MNRLRFVGVNSSVNTSADVTGGHWDGNDRFLFCRSGGLSGINLNIAVKSLAAQPIRRHHEYPSPGSHDCAAELKSGSAGAVDRPIPSRFEIRDEPRRKCNPRSSRLRLPCWSLAGSSSKTEASTRQ